MATALQIINRATRLLGVKDAVENLEGEVSSDCFDVLNAMLAEWYEADIGVPDYSFATLSTDLASDAADSEAIAYQLALRIAPEFEVTPSARMERSAEEAMGRLRLRYFQPGTAVVDLPPDMDESLGLSDFNSGNF